MSAGPGSALDAVRADSVRISGSAVVVGTARLGEGSLLAQGAVIRSHGAGVEVGTGSAVLENSVIVGNTGIPTIVGRRTTFGLLLSGLAACTAMTLRMYAVRKGWELTTIGVDVRYDVADDERGAIERTITVPIDLPPEQRDRLADIAERTPVTLALRGGTPITTTFRSDNTS